MKLNCYPFASFEENGYFLQVEESIRFGNTDVNQTHNSIRPTIEQPFEIALRGFVSIPEVLKDILSIKYHIIYNKLN